MRLWFKIFIRQNGMVHKRRWVNFLTMVRKLEASTVCLRESTKRVQLSAGSRRPRSSCSSGGSRAQSGGQAKKAPISSWDFGRNCYSLFRCAHDDLPWSPAQCSNASKDVVLSCCLKPMASLISLINNLIVWNKSCYRSIINRKLNNK